MESNGKGSNGKREFAGYEIAAALSFIEELPPGVQRIQVDVWDGAWQFAYGDDRSRVHTLLDLVVRGRRFRVRGRNGMI